MIGRAHQRHERQPEAQLGHESSDAATTRQLDATTSEARLSQVPRRLLEKLKTYPQLRDHVLDYLKVRERVDSCTAMWTKLRRAGTSPDEEFWEALDESFGSHSLRRDLSDSLLAGKGVSQLVERFDVARETGRGHVRAALDPHQSAQAALEVTQAVREMRAAAEELADMCRRAALDLLDELKKCVDQIFADESEGPAGAAASERSSTDASLPGQAATAVDRHTAGTETPRTGEVEHRQRRYAPAADVEAHLLRPTRKE